MNLSQGVVLFLAALAAGAINAVAGGGSFLSFPSLLLVGIPPVNANATSTVALWPGQPASVWAYRREIKDIARRAFVMLTVTGIIGGISGAYVLLITPQTTFMRLVPWLLLGATLIFTFSGRVTRLLGQRKSRPHAAFTSPHGILLLLILAFYLGYFGAGAGILLLATLSVLGMDNIHAMNALKAWLTAVSNGVAMLLFIVHRAVYWPEALLMVVGSVTGGYFGAYFAQKTKPSNVRMIVIVIGFGMTAYFFGRQFWH
jgi:uncharacterized protein